MKLSIITVNLNNLNGLRKTIDSVVTQTFNDFEWIVIDGGSTDGSKELIEQYAEHFAYWVSEPDAGIYNAMNKGIRVAKGEYLQFLNSGDWLYDEKTLYSVFSSCPSSDILFGNCLVRNTDNGVFEIGPKDTNFTAFELLSKSLPHQATFIKKDLFERYGLYDETFRITGDMKFIYNVIVNHEVSLSYLPFVIVNYDGTGISNTQFELCQKETERVVLEYLPARLLGDFRIYNDVILNKQIMDSFRNKEMEEKKAVRIYNALNRYWPTRIMVNGFYKMLKLHKKQV